MSVEHRSRRFREAILAAVMERKVSQNEIGRMSGVLAVRIAGWKTGRLPLQPGDLAAIGLALEWTPEQLAEVLDEAAAARLSSRRKSTIYVLDADTCDWAMHEDFARYFYRRFGGDAPGFDELLDCIEELAEQVIERSDGQCEADRRAIELRSKVKEWRRRC